MGGNGHAAVGTNLSFTKFVFVLLYEEDAATEARLRSAGTTISRGFFNDYDADGARDPQPQETIQFLIAEPTPKGGHGTGAARYVVHLSGNYRPRLDEVVSDFERRLSGSAELLVLDGAERAPRYTSAEMHNYAYKPASPRLSGRAARNAIVLPINKTPAWWEKTALERHSYFYPHHQDGTGCPVKGHARAAEAGITTVYRKLYHNPDGYQRKDEFDFLTYFECTDENIPVFEEVCRALRDPKTNPEWTYVVEGPEWRGRRVLRW